MWQVVGVQRVSVRGLLLCDFSTQAFHKNQMISKVLRHSKLIWGEKSNWEWSVCLVVLLYLALIILLLGFKNRQKKKTTCKCLPTRGVSLGSGCAGHLDMEFRDVFTQPQENEKSIGPHLQKGSSFPKSSWCRGW